MFSHHHLGQLLIGHLIGIACCDHFAAAQHGHAMRNRAHMMYFVCNQDHHVPGVCESLDVFEKQFGLLRG